METLKKFIINVLVICGILGVGFVAFTSYFNSHAIENMNGDMRACVLCTIGDRTFIAAELKDTDKYEFANFFGNDRKSGIYAIPSDTYVDLGDGKFVDRTNVLVFK
jgi:hypothetical protein